MNKLFIKLLLSITFFTTLAFANSSIQNSAINNELYFFPKQADDAKDRIVSLIEDSKDSIYIAMYNFSYKKFAKKLIKASKRGVKVTVIFDDSKVKKDDKIYKLLKKNNITVLIPKKKLHTKLAIFDDEIIILGSTNWTKESFKDNYEVILFSDDKKLIKQSKKFIKKLFN